jgi:hypothetical protein
LIKAGLARGSWWHSGADAKNMGRILARNGFIKDMSTCNRPGVVRIYGGNHSGHRFRNRLLGDRLGHIEILGTDYKYYSYFMNDRPINESMKYKYGYESRRPLIGCWYHP